MKRYILILMAGSLLTNAVWIYTRYKHPHFLPIRDVDLAACVSDCKDWTRITRVSRMESGGPDCECGPK